MEPSALAAGGVYRVGVEAAFNFTGGFDPTGEYLNVGLGIYSNLLVRTLLGYRHIPGPEGNELIPDLAVALPEVSPDGLTYTFRLKDGIRFGPPVSREITALDIAYAFKRIGTQSLVAQYGFYYDVIEGMAEFKAGEADTISGIEAPDEKTIVFHLTEPAGDFPYRLSLPATGPIPREVAECFTDAGEYGRFVISSGPYMIEGSEALDLTSCETMEPLSGFDPSSYLTLVRNPDYDSATDTSEARESLPDRFEFLVNTSNRDIFAKLRAGELEGELAAELPNVVREYTSDPALRDRIAANPGDGVLYVSMNLTQPPFDDLHVRRAVNLALDKAALLHVIGGEIKGMVATHIVPDSLLQDLLSGYDPYPSPDHAGDLEAARKEMSLSRYDEDGDGRCDAQACSFVLNIAGTGEQQKSFIPIIEDSLAKLGIHIRTRVFADAFAIVGTLSRNIPLTSLPGWGKDIPDASIFMVLFDGRVISPTGNFNYSLVGLTPEQARQLEGLEGNLRGVPSVDADLDRCRALAGDERVRCWADLDRKLMEEIAPIVPFIFWNWVDVVGPAVAQYQFDQFSGLTAYAHVAVDPARQ